MVEGWNARILEKNPSTKFFVNRFPEGNYVCSQCENNVKPLHTDWQAPNGQQCIIYLVPKECTTCRGIASLAYDQSRKADAYNSMKSTKCGGYEGIKRTDWYSGNQFLLQDYHPKDHQYPFWEYICEVADGNIEYGAYVQGGVGTGKTTACEILNNELIERGKRVCFLRENELIDLLRLNSKRESEYEVSDLVQDLQKVDFLIIDDFGTVKDTEFVIEKEFQIMNARYAQKKITIVNSNEALPSIAVRNPRLASRMQDVRWMKHFMFGMDDLRKDKKSQKPLVW